MAHPGELQSPPLGIRTVNFSRESLAFSFFTFLSLSGVAGFKDGKPRARVKGVRVLKLFRLARLGGVHELSGIKRHPPTHRVWGRGSRVSVLKLRSGFVACRRQGRKGPCSYPIVFLSIGGGDCIPWR